MKQENRFVTAQRQHKVQLLACGVGYLGLWLLFAHNIRCLYMHTWICRMCDVSACFWWYMVLKVVMRFTPLSDEGVCGITPVYPTGHVLKNLSFIPLRGEKPSWRLCPILEETCGTWSWHHRRQPFPSREASIKHHRYKYKGFCPNGVDSRCKFKRSQECSFLPG
jgi:hypothetical protein